MGVVAADADASRVALGGRAGRAGLLVVEVDVVVDEVADGLHAWPARRGGAKEAPGEVEHAVTFAEAAGEEEDQGLVGQLLYRVLAGIGDYRVGQTAVADNCVGADADLAGGGGERPHQLPKPSR